MFHRQYVEWDGRYAQKINTFLYFTSKDFELTSNMLDVLRLIMDEIHQAIYMHDFLFAKSNFCMHQLKKKL